MPIIKSAKKRVRTAQKAAVRNSKAKRTLKNALKVFQKSTIEKKDVVKQLNAAQSALDKAAKKGLVHKNKAARTKKRLAAQAKAVAGTSSKTATPKKAVAKKPTTKK